MEENAKKFSFAEGLLLILITLFADALDSVIGLLGVFPPLLPVSIGLSWLINAFIMGLLLFVFFIKGERGLWVIAGSVLEFIPFISILPLRTATCLVAIYLANHPKIKALTNVDNKLAHPKDNNPKTDSGSPSVAPALTPETQYQEAA